MRGSQGVETTFLVAGINISLFYDFMIQFAVPRRQSQAWRARDGSRTTTYSRIAEALDPRGGVVYLVSGRLCAVLHFVMGKHVEMMMMMISQPSAATNLGQYGVKVSAWPSGVTATIPSRTNAPGTSLDEP